MEKINNSRSPTFKLKKNYYLSKIKNLKRPQAHTLLHNFSSFYEAKRKNISLDSSSTLDFLQRNYDNYLSNINRKKKFYSQLISQSQLNSLLYKFKHYYNDIRTMNNEKEKSLISLKETLKFEQFKLNQLIEFQDIELPEEKISVRNFNELKLTKDDVEQKLKEYLKEQQNLNELIKNSLEYFKTIDYMCENERNRFREIKNEINNVEEKINNVEKYQKIIDYNLGKDKIKNKGQKEINIKLRNDLALVDKVNDNQKRKQNYLDIIISKKEKKIEELKNQLIEYKKQNKTENNLHQIDKQKQIENMKEYTEDQKNKEKRCVEIIYSLFLIQKYFINEEKFDRKKMESSKEYKLLSNNIFDINLNQKTNKDHYLNYTMNYNNLEKGEEKALKKDNDNNNEKMLLNLNEKISIKSSNIPLIGKRNVDESLTFKIKKSNSTKNIGHIDYSKFIKNKIENDLKNKKEKNEKEYNINDEKNQRYELENKDSKINNKIYMNTIGNCNFITSPNLQNNFITKKKRASDILTLGELKSLFESIKINKEKLFNYNSKLTSILNFYKNQFNIFHNKEILLEQNKSSLSKKVEKAISEDFLSFKQLVKSKPEIKDFVINNFDVINDIKHQNKKMKLNIINQKIIQSNSLNKMDNLKNSENISKIDDQFNKNLNLIISSSEKIILSNKNFFIECIDYLKQIENTIKTLNNKDKKENEKKKKHLNEDNISEIESKNNIKEKDDTDEGFLKMIIKEKQQLEELIKTMTEKNVIEKKDLVNYIKDLIDISQTNEELKDIFDLIELNNNLLYPFYKDNNHNKIKTSFYKQFELKRLPILKDTFNHFTTYKEPTIDNINQIIAIIHDIEKNLNNLINMKNHRLFLKRSRDFSKISALSRKNSNNNLDNNLDNLSNYNDNNDKIYLNCNSPSHKKRAFEGFGVGTGMSEKDTSYSELEFMSGGKVDEDDILDNEVDKKEKRILKRKINSIEENIVKKLYSPIIEKTYYLRQLNKNMKGIKSMTTNNCLISHTLRKRTKQIDILTDQMLLYNNPRINPNKLSNSTYNSLINLAISTKNFHKKEKRYKFTFTPKK